MIPEEIFALSSSMFLYTLQGGEGRQWDGEATAPGGEGAGRAARGEVRGWACPKRPWHKTCPQLAARRGWEGATAHGSSEAPAPFERAEVPPPSTDRQAVLWK